MWYMAIVKSYDPLFMKKIAVMSLVPNLQFSAIHDSGKGPSIQASLILNKIIQHWDVLEKNNSPIHQFCHDQNKLS